MSALSVVNAQHITGHILDITFSDGHNAVVDFAPFIFSAGHPDYEFYKKLDNFLAYKLDDGNLNWDDYTMIFSVEDLYHNRLIKRPA